MYPGERISTASRICKAGCGLCACLKAPSIGSQVLLAMMFSGEIGCQRSFEANPEDLSRRKRLANRLRNLGRGEEAEALLSEAVAEYRRDYDAYFEGCAKAKGVRRGELDSTPRVVLLPGAGALCFGRSKREARIVADIRSGLPKAHSVTIEHDRRRAIRLAIAAAAAGDAVVIAGKGHETTQLAGTSARRFDDRLEARAALEGSR